MSDQDEFVWRTKSPRLRRELKVTLPETTMKAWLWRQLPAEACWRIKPAALLSVPFEDFRLILPRLLLPSLKKHWLLKPKTHTFQPRTYVNCRSGYKLERKRGRGKKRTAKNDSEKWRNAASLLSVEESDFCLRLRDFFSLHFQNFEALVIKAESRHLQPRQGGLKHFFFYSVDVCFPTQTPQSGTERKHLARKRIPLFFCVIYTVYQHPVSSHFFPVPVSLAGRSAFASSRLHFFCTLPKQS